MLMNCSLPLAPLFYHTSNPKPDSGFDSCLQNAGKNPIQDKKGKYDEKQQMDIANNVRLEYQMW